MQTAPSTQSTAARATTASDFKPRVRQLRVSRGVPPHGPRPGDRASDAGVVPPGRACGGEARRVDEAPTRSVRVLIMCLRTDGACACEDAEDVAEDETALVWDAALTTARYARWVSTALRLAPAFPADTVDDEKAFEAAVAAVVGYSLVDLQRSLSTQHRH